MGGVWQNRKVPTNLLEIRVGWYRDWPKPGSGFVFRPRDRQNRDRKSGSVRLSTLYHPIYDILSIDLGAGGITEKYLLLIN